MTTMKDILDDQRARDVLRPAARRLHRELPQPTWASVIDPHKAKASSSPRRGPDTEQHDHMQVYANVY